MGKSGLTQNSKRQGLAPRRIFQSAGDIKGANRLAEQAGKSDYGQYLLRVLKEGTGR